MINAVSDGPAGRSNTGSKWYLTPAPYKVKSGSKHGHCGMVSVSTPSPIC